MGKSTNFFFEKNLNYILPKNFLITPAIIMGKIGNVLVHFFDERQEKRLFQLMWWCVLYVVFNMLANIGYND